MTINTRRKIALKMNIDNKNKNKSRIISKKSSSLNKKMKIEESRKYEKNQII